MVDFLLFFNQKREIFPMHLEITYNKHTEWCIYVYRKGYADRYPGSVICGEDAVIVSVQDEDMELCFAKAHVAMKEWLAENEGGY